MSVPASQVSGPTGQVSGFGFHVIGPAGQVSVLTGQVNGPVGRASGPGFHVSGPVGPASNFAGQVSGPVGQVGGPGFQIRGLAGPVGIPAGPWTEKPGPVMKSWELRTGSGLWSNSQDGCPGKPGDTRLGGEQG